MSLNFQEAKDIYRSPTTTRGEGLAAVAKLGLSDRRLDFLRYVLAEAALANFGDNSEILGELRHYPNLCAEYQIDRIASEQAKEAELVLLSNDDSMIEAGLWDYVNIPGIEMNVAACGSNLPKGGWHLLHGGIGAGKTENVLLPEAKKHKGKDRALVIVPNIRRAYELAKELRWAHYHTYGKTPANVKKAILSHDQLVICAQSVRHITDVNGLEPYQHIYVDELCEILKFAEPQNANKEKGESAWQSLESLWQLGHNAYRFLGFTADAPKAYVLNVMDKAAREFNRRAFYYRTMQSFAQGQTYLMMPSERDLILSVAQRLNDGLSAWGYVDFSASKLALPIFANILRRLCPGKRIEWFDADKVNENIMGQPIREMGLVEYIKHKRREGELDCFIASPFARSQYSILFDDHEADLIFDFAFACLKHPDIGTPQDGDQGLGRSRQTKLKLVYINEAYKRHSVVRKNIGLNVLRKTWKKDEDLSTAQPWEKVAFHNRVATEQYRLANRASRKWLFMLMAEQRGARVIEPKIGFSHEEFEAYEKLKASVTKETEDAEKGRSLENNTTLRHQKLKLAYQWSGSSWRTLRHDEYDEDELNRALKIDGKTANRIFDILTTDLKGREIMDRHIAEQQWVITGYLLDLIFFELQLATSLRTQSCFFDWFLHGEDDTWFILPEHVFDEFSLGLQSNFEFVKRTINPRLSTGRTVASFLKAVGENIGLEIISTVAKEERSLWRDALFAQYKIPKKLKVAQKYDCVEESIKPMLNHPNFAPTYEERRFLDTLPDVFRVTKKRTVSRDVVNVYEHYLKAMKTSGAHAPSEGLKEDLQDQKEALMS